MRPVRSSDVCVRRSDGAYVDASAFDRAVDAGWTTPDERAAIVKTWQAWGEEPGAFVARVWCEAIGWADDD
ncbi:MAG TPA: hypothetical protein VEX15_05175 [Nocardioidaceae bacterium]|nr:hypothetical protein [Nocardioidaceae bacterium]